MGIFIIRSPPESQILSLSCKMYYYSTYTKQHFSDVQTHVIGPLVNVVVAWKPGPTQQLTATVFHIRGDKNK